MMWTSLVLVLLALQATVGRSDSTAAVRSRQLTEEDPFASERQRVEAWVRSGNTTVIFLHVHKAGGTTVCNMAKASRVRVPPTAESKSWYGKNCNPLAADIPAAWRGTPEVMLQYARDAQLQFYAIEARLPAVLPWGKAAFVGVVRQPLPLMFTNCGANVKCWQSYPNRQIMLYVGCSTSLELFHDEDLPPNVPEKYCDNRKFLRNRVTREHLEAAKRRAQRFSLVLPTERLSDAGPLLKAKFGWRASDASRHRGGTQSSAGRNANYLKLMDRKGLRATVMANTALDHEFYDFAVQRLDAQLEALREEQGKK